MIDVVVRRVQTRAVSRAPVGRVIPLRVQPPLPLLPQVSPTGRVAAQRCALTQPHKENDP